MNVQECYEQLRVMKFGKPFKPFQIETNEGKSFVVSDPWKFASNGKSIYLVDQQKSCHFIPHDKVAAITTVSNG